jgi:protease II
MNLFGPYLFEFRRINTMSDPTIPLTVPEWEEWGNSNERIYFDYMMNYCPYSNVKKQVRLVKGYFFMPN